MPSASAPTILALIWLGSVACTAPAKPPTSGAPGSSARTTMTGPLTPTELAAFAPLPTQMLAGTNAPSAEAVALGRALYYETLLSGGHNVSCNSCHPLNGFGADGRARSLGDHGQPGGRNAPSVYNAAGHLSQFWDGRAATVEEQAKGPVLNPAEMGMPNAEAVLTHLRALPAYRALFAKAFPGEGNPITYDNVGIAIGAFERGLVTPARWDALLSGDSSAITTEEQQGARLFVATGCATCHNGAYLGGSMYMRAGLKSPWPMRGDSGRYAVTKQPEDLYVFKVPSLRNVTMTGPYFSDGSVASLDEAILLMGRHQLGVELSPTDIAQLRAFLGTLTGTLPVSYIAFPQLPTP